MNFVRICLVCIGALSTYTLSAQAPATDLYLFQLSQKDTSWTIHSPRLLSGFNDGGYTNQPEFITDDLLYVSVQKNGETQNDIYGLHIRTNELERITSTPESEFSPALTPDGEYFTCIRQNDTDTIDQRLYKYPLSRNENGVDLFVNSYNIGYHTWLSDKSIALFLVTDPTTLAWGNVESGDIRPVVSKIGRCLKSGEDGKLLYVHKYTPEVWYLKSMADPADGSVILTETPKSREDFVQSSTGTLFMADGGLLYAFNPASDSGWKLVSDLSNYGLNNITRLAINDQGELALVNVRQGQ